VPVKKIIKLLRRQGAHATSRIVYERLRTHYYMLRMRTLPLARPSLAYAQLRNRLQTLPVDQLVPIVDSAALRAAADLFAHDRLVAFGTHTQALSPTLWHTDICLQQADKTADIYFAPLPIERIALNFTGSGDGRVKDIKVPWELSRLQQLVVLARAYEQYHDERYAHAAHRQLQHWLQYNPYLYGVNWLCAMEVGIRATNIILALAVLVQADACDDAALQIYCDSLYAHMEFIAYHWEWYDGRTSNHYLADLVGYLYLCWLLYDLPGMPKRASWAYAEIVNEMQKQVHPEGTDYEGSTTYHAFVMQMFEHAQKILTLLGFIMPAWWHERLARMRVFVQWCSYSPGKMIMIGDCDSGSLVWPGFTATQRELPEGTIHYTAFGLTLWRTDRLHMSVRHHAYQSRQPSGHFHNDAGSITLAIDGIPVIVDPGTFLYTGWPTWRNRFRSASMHNCMSIKDHEPTPFDAHLFFLAQQETSAGQQVFYDPVKCSTHRLYERFGLKAERKTELDNDTITISDRWYKIGDVPTPLHSQWHLMLHPDIELHKHDEYTWLLMHHKRQLCTIITDYPLVARSSWMSPAYGNRVATTQLCGEQPMVVDQVWQMRIVVS
jgi:hypothetical protein